jgi:PAS domain S-box-containing protein
MPETENFNTLISALAGNRHSAVIYADAGGCIGFWNSGAEVLFGHLAAEALGKRVDLMVPEQYREMHWTGFNRTIGSAWRGSTAWGAVPGLHKNGHEIALEVFLIPIQGASERVEGVMAIFRFPLSETGPSTKA